MSVFKNQNSSAGSLKVSPAQIDCPVILYTLKKENVQAYFIFTLLTLHITATQHLKLFVWVDCLNLLYF